MNVPVGSVVENCVEIAGFNLQSKAVELSRKGFSGYIALTIEGHTGIEEGLILFRNGEITGSVYEFLKLGQVFFSGDALQLSANASRALHGIVDVIELSKQQAELVIAFNDKMGFERPVQAKDLSRLMQSIYDIELVKKFVGGKLRKEESKLDILKRIGLKEI